jgi:hypothetical protein
MELIIDRFDSDADLIDQEKLRALYLPLRYLLGDEKSLFNRLIIQ